MTGKKVDEGGEGVGAVQAISLSGCLSVSLSVSSFLQIL